jgi:hypothetical protein
MGHVFVAEFAVFLCFHAVGVVLFFFHCVVVALFALGTRQCDFCTHFDSLALEIYMFFFTPKKHRRPMFKRDSSICAVGLSNFIFSHCEFNWW